MNVEREENRLAVSYEGHWIYDIVFRSSYHGIVDEMTALGYLKNTKICIVTDSNVVDLYAKKLKDILNTYFETVVIFAFNSGESNKNIETIQKLYGFLINNQFERKDLLLACGGGVTGDMAGFAAATYLRGVDYIQVPTTLLAQVDSSIGGKTGVDFLQYKNMIGAFKQPKLVYINKDALRTLPSGQFASGMAEAIKSAMIKDAAYVDYLWENREKIQGFASDELQKTIQASCKIKREVVEKDPTEKGERALLNFGHTIGHAIEKLSNFSLYHGECVALGMVAATWISMEMGNLQEDALSSCEKILRAYHLPVSLKDRPNLGHLDDEDILRATKSDKKMENGRVKFVLLKDVGNAYISRDVTDELLLKGIHYLKR